jgi:GDP/UDP-N,N'-diacetylbacillosamine 2-epimerase (hydrolysing)
MSVLRKISIVTGSRADYGLLKNLIKLINDDKSLTLNLIVTGSHFSKTHGNTYKEIEYDGYNNYHKIDINIINDDIKDLCNSTALSISGFSKAYSIYNPDLIVILGDRYELLGAAISAMFYKIPIAHIHGGELTFGAIDDSIRHSLTKLSQIHFVATETYRKRVIQLGENPKFVFNVGGLGVDAIKNLKLLPKKDLEKNLKIKLKKSFFLVTFHPVTLEDQTEYEQVKELLNALIIYKNYQIIFTMPNADQNNNIIFKLINEFVDNNINSFSFESLGQLNYLSCIAHSTIIIGNSSSGLLEAPSFKKPTINIGSRQEGRIKASSIIDCSPKTNSIINAIETALSPSFQVTLKNTLNPYEGKNTSKSIHKILKNNGSPKPGSFRRLLF